MARLCLFPGQGSQSVGMGKELFDLYPHLVKASSEVVGYDVEQMCLTASDKQLSNTELTQPLLYVVNALSYLRHVETTGVVPEFLAGHSLGEYAALFAAGSFDFITGLQLVKERGRLMSLVKGGAMYAVIGLPSDEIMATLAANDNDKLSIANYNSYNQTVVAGKMDDYEFLKDIFSAAGALNVIKLNVSACFHTFHMKEIADKYQQYLEQYRFSRPKIVVIANVTANPYQKDDDIKSMLVRQLYSPVLWQQSMEYALAKVGNDWAEVGPGRVLSNLMLHISEEKGGVTSH